MKISDDIQYTKSSGNVFKDLGFKNAQERLAKAQLAAKINEIIHKRRLKQAQAATILGINQPKVSALIHGRLSGFSMERLILFLNKLDQDIKIIITEKPKRLRRKAKIKVTTRQLKPEQEKKRA